MRKVATGFSLPLHPAAATAALLCALLTGHVPIAAANGDRPSVPRGPAAGQGADTGSGIRPEENGPAVTAPGRRDRGVFLYGGQWSDNRFVEILQLETHFRPSGLGALGAGTTLHRFGRHLLLEGEVNLARHWGRQDHFEANAAANLRWTTFPWDRVVDTSFAFGLGPSYAFDRPPIEARHDRAASRGLVFMMAEITFAPPERHDASWEGLIRIHHRSGVFDVISRAAGSNFVVAGVRYRF